MSAAVWERFPWGLKAAAVIVGAVVLVIGFVWLRGGSDSDKPAAECVKTRPALPGAVRQNTVAGIEATVRFEYRAVNYGQCTGDVAPLRQIYDVQACRNCALLLEGLPTYTAGGNRFVTGNYKIISFEAFLNRRPDGVSAGSARFSTSRAAVKIVNRDGRTVKTYKPQRETFFSDTLEFRDGRWLITGSTVG